MMEGNDSDPRAERRVVNGHKRRRISHVMLSLGVVYYWLPDPLYVEGVPKWWGLLAATFLACVIEFIRIKRRVPIPGMRPYEERRIGGYLYAVIGTVLVLWFSPISVGVPCIIGMACCDPLAGELRHAKHDERRVVVFTAIAYALIALCSLIALGVKPVSMIALIAIMTPLAVLSEQIDIKYLDDDLTMLVVPAAAGTLLLRII
jgi:dolichol kinase